jgi:hypothetical protein
MAMDQSTDFLAAKLLSAVFCSRIQTLKLPVFDFPTTSNPSLQRPFPNYVSLLRVSMQHMENSLKEVAAQIAQNSELWISGVGGQW